MKELNNLPINDESVYKIVMQFLNQKKITNFDLEDESLVKKNVEHAIVLLVENEHLKKENVKEFDSLSSYIKVNTNQFKKEQSTKKEKQKKIMEELGIKDLSKGLVHLDKNLQFTFINLYWTPFTKNLYQLSEIVKQRTKVGFDLGSRMPSQATLDSVLDECLDLTEIWYGEDKGNISVVLKYFYIMCENAKLTFYHYEDVELYQSDDGYVSNANRKALEGVIQEYMDNVLNPFLSQGGQLLYRKSKIDDLHTEHVVSKQYADNLLTISYMKKIAVALIELEQKEKIATLKQEMGLETASEVIEELGKFAGTDNTLAFELLCRDKAIIQDWGQIPQEVKQQIWQDFSDVLDSQETQKMSPVLQDFCAHLKKNPKALYKAHNVKKYFPGLADSKNINETIKDVGVLTEELAVINSSVFDGVFLQRHLKNEWTRKTDFLDKEKGKQEITRYRINQLPYKKNHLLAIIDYEHESFDNKVKDLEILVNQLMRANPAYNKRLPEEEYFDVMQNANMFSSILETHHVHLSMCDISQLLFYQKVNQPVSILGASFDIIVVGDSEDASFLKAVVKNPNEEKFLLFFNEIVKVIKELYQEVDIQFHLAPNKDESFTVVMGYFAKVKKVINNYYKNQDTKEVIQIKGVPMHLKKEIVPGATDGQEQLKKMYEFAKIKGVYLVLQNFLNKNSL